MGTDSNEHLMQGVPNDCWLRFPKSCSEAQLSLKLASDWIVSFDCERRLGVELGRPADVGDPKLASEPMRRAALPPKRTRSCQPRRDIAYSSCQPSRDIAYSF